MLSVRVEQRVNVKFLVKLGRSATGTYNLLKEVYGDECLSRSQVFDWFKKFKEGREDIEDDPRPGRPRTSKTDDNIEKIGEIVRNDRRRSIRAIAEIANIDKETVRQILHDNLDMKKVCAKVVPKLLTPEQKEIRMSICADVLENIENDPNFLENVITCDETWIFQNDLESERKSMKFKAMMIVFFDIRGIIHIDWVPEGLTVNQAYYLDVLKLLQEQVRRKRQELWKNDTWILHQDNTPTHNALSIKQFLAKKKIPLLEYPPYSPDLAPCDFFLFPKIKSALKGTRFESVDTMKEKATELMNTLSEKDLHQCFHQWKIRMELCRDRGGEYIEGDNISIV